MFLNKIHYSIIRNHDIYFWLIHYVKNFLVIGVVFLMLMYPLAPNIALASSISEGKIVELTNEERIKNNLPALSVDPLLYQAAQNKAEEMIARHYFDHYTPEGLAPWDFMEQAGYKYLLAGENLAMDFRTSEGIHNAWMKSATHRANILNKNYEDIAIAIKNGEIDNKQTTLVVQMFGKEDVTFLGRINFLTSKISSIVLGVNF